MADIRGTGIKNAHFQNWSNTFSCTPELFFAPNTLKELKRILKLALQENKEVRVVGCGHSPSDIACTEGFSISLMNFNEVVAVDENKKQITVQAGITLRELNEVHLPKYNFAFSVLGSISDVTVGGAICTGTHGTGIKFGLFSTYVVNLEILASDGTIYKCSREENEDLFLASLCGLGSIGIILTATLQCETAFNLLQSQYGMQLEDVLAHLDLHLQSSDHFRFMYFPYTDNVVASHLTRTELPLTKKTGWTSLVSWFWDYAIGYHSLEFCYYISTIFPQLVPVINRFFYNYVFSRSQKRVDVSHKVFNFECLFKQYVTEWAIAKERVAEVLWSLRECIELNCDIRAHFPIEVRFAKADDIFISPAYGRDTCYINIIMYRPYGISVPHEKYWSEYERILLEAGGRPHWAKAHRITTEKFQDMYPCFEKWCNVRKRLDPFNMFWNSYMKRIFPFHE